MVSLLAVMMLSGCYKRERYKYISPCLPLYSHSAEQQRKVADEIMMHPDAAWVDMINKYAELRRSVRAVCAMNQY